MARRRFSLESPGIKSEEQHLGTCPAGVAIKNGARGTLATLVAGRWPWTVVFSGFSSVVSAVHCTELWTNITPLYRMPVEPYGVPSQMWAWFGS